MAFHSLHATSQALQPMQIEVSVKNPLRGVAVLPAGIGRRVGGTRELVAPEAHRCSLSSSWWVTSWLPVSTVVPDRDW